MRWCRLFTCNVQQLLFECCESMQFYSWLLMVCTGPLSTADFISVATCHVHMCASAAGRHVLDVLEPLSDEHGGPLHIQHISFVEGRGNIIVEYPGTDPAAGVVSFVGAHLVSTCTPQGLLGSCSFGALVSPVHTLVLSCVRRTLTVRV